MHGGDGIVKEGRIWVQNSPEITTVKVFLYRPGTMNGSITANDE